MWRCSKHGKWRPPGSDQCGWDCRATYPWTCCSVCVRPWKIWSLPKRRMDYVMFAFIFIIMKSLSVTYPAFFAKATEKWSKQVATWKIRVFAETKVVNMIQSVHSVELSLRKGNWGQKALLQLCAGEIVKLHNCQKLAKGKFSRDTVRFISNKMTVLI